MSSLKKVLLKNKTRMSLHERFTNIRINEDRGATVTDRIGEQIASSRNRRLAEQLERRSLAGSGRTSNSISNYSSSVSVRDRLSLPAGYGSRRGRGQIPFQRKRGSLNRSGSTMSVSTDGTVGRRGRSLFPGGHESRRRSRSMSRGRSASRPRSLSRPPQNGSGPMRSKSPFPSVRGSPANRFRGGTRFRGFRSSRGRSSIGQGFLSRRAGSEFRGRTRGLQSRGRSSRGSRGRGRFSGGRRGIGSRQGSINPPTKEELDSELDQYMSTSKAHLDKEMDEYMHEESWD